MAEKDKTSGLNIGRGVAVGVANMAALAAVSRFTPLKFSTRAQVITGAVAATIGASTGAKAEGAKPAPAPAPAQSPGGVAGPVAGVVAGTAIGGGLIAASHQSGRAAMAKAAMSTPGRWGLAIAGGTAASLAVQSAVGAFMGSDAKAKAEKADAATSKAPRPAAAPASGGSGPIEVPGYTRADGVQVQGYTRQRK